MPKFVKDHWPWFITTGAVILVTGLAVKSMASTNKEDICDNKKRIDMQQTGMTKMLVKQGVMVVRQEAMAANQEKAERQRKEMGDDIKILLQRVQ